MNKTVWKGYLQAPKQGIHSNGAPCQDNVHLVETDDLLVITLSDGLGSLLHSDIASKATTIAAANFLINYNFDEWQGKEQFASDLITVCKKAVISEANSSGLDISQMDCTLLFAMVFKGKNGHITGQLGDGAICQVKFDSAIKIQPVSVNKAGANMTKTLFSSDAEEHFSLNIEKSDNLLGILLTSDGLQNEIYSDVGDVKNNLQWYYNCISMYQEKSAEFILNRWEELASNHADEFSDDMSLAVLYQPNKETNLPQDANWLCICGHRNNLESTRCGACAKDFLKLYKGAPYREYGGKKQFFLYMNEHPKEEENILHKLSMYSPFSKSDNNSTNEQEQANFITLDEVKQPAEEETIECIENFSRKRELSKSTSYPPSTEIASSKKKNIKVEDIENQLPTRPKTPKEKKGGIKRIVKSLLCLTLSFILGFSVHFCISFFTDVLQINEQKAIIASLEHENHDLQKENDIISQNFKLLQQQFEKNESNATGSSETLDENLRNYDYYHYQNGNVYYGSVEDDLPNGFGVLFTTEKVYVGLFSDGKKEGEFYLFDDTGESECVIYQDDNLVVNDEKTGYSLNANS